MQILKTFAPSMPADNLSDADSTATIGLFFRTKKGMPAHLLDGATHDDIVRRTVEVGNVVQQVDNNLLLFTAGGL
jgi:hypothetical protein